MDTTLTNQMAKTTKQVLENDTRTPNQRRLDELITINDNMLIELEKMNKNLAIVGQALINIANPILKVEAERSKGKRLANNDK